ncbi:MAG: RimK/LysX family protein [Candidatus Woesearchaeota archaeon]
MARKIVLGAVEEIKIIGTDGERFVKARIDTGAKLCSIDMLLVSELRLGPITEAKKIRSANGRSLRLIINVEFVLKGKRCIAKFTVADRSHMSYPMIIGRNVLEDGFVIDLNESRTN